MISFDMLNKKKRNENYLLLGLKKYLIKYFERYYKTQNFAMLPRAVTIGSR